MNILAIDLGKFNSMSVLFNRPANLSNFYSPSGSHSYLLNARNAPPAGERVRLSHRRSVDRLVSSRSC